jgi:hypothetical protein
VKSIIVKSYAGVFAQSDVLQLGEEADLEARNCRATTKVY